MKIDFHAHSFPREFFFKLKEYYPNDTILREDAQGRLVAVLAGTPLPAWDHGQRVEVMTRAGALRSPEGHRAEPRLKPR
jgi:hypothetical protein